LLRPGLRLVFIGYNPGLESARQGHYYAFPGNVFWKQLNASGLVPRPVGPGDDRLLPAEAGIGFTDLCRRPTLRAGELTAAELREGALRLHAELLEHRPQVAVFSGRGIYQLFGRHALGLAARELAARPYGFQPETIGAGHPHDFPTPGADEVGVTRCYVVPSSSGLASRWHLQRLSSLRELNEWISKE
jgi:TDG/mug DNA glycosylase family protein